MSTPPPRMSMPRSSFAIAMKDYTLIRPGMAVTVSAATLVAALIIGVLLVQQVLEGLSSTDAATTTQARQAMIVLLHDQDTALFDAAEASQRGVLLATVLLALTILAPGLLIVPMAWLYVRYKRGAAIEVKV